MSRIFLTIPLFFSTAFAQQAGAKGNEMISTMIIIGIGFLFMYFFIMRPNSKKQKEHQALLSALKKGDEVATISGMIGRVVAINENFVSIEVAPNVEIKLRRQAIASLLPKGTYKDEIK